MAVIVALCCACGGQARAPEAPVPSPFPTPGVGGVARTHWEIPRWSGSAPYKFSRTGIVESDSAGEKPIAVASAAFATLSRSPGSRGISYSLVTGGDGASRNRIRASALVTGRHVAVESEQYAPTSCNPATAQLRADLADLALPVGEDVSAGQGWDDSLTVDVCIGGIPCQAREWRHFDPIADTTIGAERAVILLRRDSLAADASGNLDQHTLSLTLAGRSLARLYVSVENGKVVLVSKTQSLNIAVVSAGRTKQFVQKSTSVAELSR